MVNNIKLKKIPERKTVCVNIRKDQAELLKDLKKTTKISMSRIIEQIIDNAYPNGIEGN